MPYKASYGRLAQRCVIARRGMTLPLLGRAMSKDDSSLELIVHTRDCACPTSVHVVHIACCERGGYFVNVL